MQRNINRCVAGFKLLLLIERRTRKRWKAGIIAACKITGMYKCLIAMRGTQKFVDLLSMRSQSNQILSSKEVLELFPTDRMSRCKWSKRPMPLEGETTDLLWRTGFDVPQFSQSQLYAWICCATIRRPALPFLRLLDQTIRILDEA